MALGCLALALGFVLVPRVQAAPSQTAQDVMVKTVLDNTVFQISGTTTYTFHKDCAEAKYTASAGTWDGNTPSCSGNATNCAPANQPPPPAAPAADEHGPNSIEHHAQQDRCTFYSGGTLDGWNYTQTAPADGLNGKGNWTFTYNYSVAAVGSVDAGTCWTCSTETGGTVDIDFTGFISSESFLKNNNTGTQKYSFTLLDSLLQSRVLNVTAVLQYSANGLFTDTVDVSTITYPSPLPVTATTADYSYFGNAGVFGNSGVYANLHATGYLPAKLVSLILTTPPDNFAGNNNDLASGNVHEADYSGSFTGLTQAGSYRIAVSGSVKENSGNGTQPFSVSGTPIIISDCEGPTPPLTCSTPTPAP
jgi:hypothetical protein